LLNISIWAPSYCAPMQVFCGSCSNHQRTIPKLNYKYEVRVCI